MDKAPPPHRTQIPNIVDDLGLDPYERALYVHYKRVCGETAFAERGAGAYCYEATRTTAGKVKMSAAQVSVSRRVLAERGLIITQDGQPVVVTVVNIWELNTGFYKLEHRPDIDGWTVGQIKLWLHDMSSDVHTVNTGSHNDIDTRSPDEHSLTEYNNVSSDVHTVNTSIHNEDNMSSYVHTVKQRIDVVHDKQLPTFEILHNRWLDNNLGKLAPRQIEMFGDYYDEHPDWVSEIIDTTIGGKPDNPWQYFVKIINSWVKNGKPAQVSVEPQRQGPARSNSPPSLTTVRNGKLPPIDMARLKQEQEAALKGQ